MPQTDYISWDRIFLIKIIAASEMSISSILLLLYCYLYVLQDWTSSPDTRYNILGYKWFIFASTAIDFGLGSLLAYASNLVNKYRRPKVILWIIFDCFLLPVSVYILRRMNFELNNSAPLSSDLHLRRTLLVHQIYMGGHLVFIMVAINFLGYYSPKLTKYNPFLRSDTVFETTDPQITTTESRHIRFSESFLRGDARKNADVEAGTSSSATSSASRSRSSSSNSNSSRMSNVGLRREISDHVSHYRLSPVPIVTAFWLKRISYFLNDPQRKFMDDSKEEALKHILMAHPDIYRKLARARMIKVMVGMEKTLKRTFSIDET